MIEIRDLHKRFGPIPALRGIDVQMSPGQVTVIAGPNGSGKTTLIKTILGLVKPDSGTIRLNGATLNGGHQYRREIGYMPQVGHFPENLRASEVLELVTSVRTESPTGDNRLLQSLKLESEMSKKISALSGGTRQKLSAVVAFLFEPGILILDEPTGGLDPTSGGILKQAILQAKEADNTVVLTRT
jgi:Cu-processing system ATP-binding protein